MSHAPVTTIDLRHRLGAARDQGPRPTCLAFAISDLHAAVRPGWTPLSCETLFFHAQRRARRLPTVGATVPDMLVAVAIDGQPFEADWPYLSALPVALSDWRPPTPGGESFKRPGVSLKPDGLEVIALLTEGRPVILLLMLSESFYVPNDQGVVRPSNGENPDPALRHAVVAIGHGVVDGETSLLIRNSWGETWGQAGYAWLPLSFVTPRLFGMALLDEDKDVSSYSNAA